MRATGPSCAPVRIETSTIVFFLILPSRQHGAFASCDEQSGPHAASSYTALSKFRREPGSHEYARSRALPQGSKSDGTTHLFPGFLFRLPDVWSMPYGACAGILMLHRQRAKNARRGTVAENRSRLSLTASCLCASIDFAAQARPSVLGRYSILVASFDATTCRMPVMSGNAQRACSSLVALAPALLSGCTGSESVSDSPSSRCVA